MKIAFDAKRAAQNRTGLGNYSRFVLDILDRYMPEGEFLLYAPNRRKTLMLRRFLGEGSRFSLHTPKGLWQTCRSLWRTFGITSSLCETQPTVYHGLSNELPLNIRRFTKGKGAGKHWAVVTIHDVIFRSFPQGYKAIDRWIYDFKMRKACENADHIIAVSEFTKQEIMRYYHTPAEKISVVYQGCDIQFRSKATEMLKAEVRAAYGLPENFVLYVGSIEERKNLLLLIKALRHLPEDVHVVACGRKTGYFEKVVNYIKEYGLESRVTFVHGVQFSHLPAMYQMAEVFVYPSRIEGFGIPLLEALCSGTPAIGCTGSCLEEAGGPGSVYVDPDDDKGLANAIIRIRNNAALRSQMIAQGHEYAALFEEKVLAERLIKVLIFGF